MAKRIGLIDFRLENFHANVYLKALRGPLKSRGWVIAGAWCIDTNDGKAWTMKNDVRWFDAPSDLNDHVDAFMILAPSNPELHLDLCRRVFPFAKTTYVDKTFAPDLASAREIFALADQHRCAIQTSSALRYTSVQDYACSIGGQNVKHMIAWGGGTSFAEYAIHPVEMLISCMGSEVKSLMRRGDSGFSQLLLNFAGDRTGIANIYTTGNTPFAASITSDKETVILTPPLDQIFVNQASAVLDLFESGRASIDRQETLAVIKILDAAADPTAQRGFVNL